MPPFPQALSAVVTAHAHRRVVSPLLGLLRMGASPRTLAWSLAVGFLFGINPILGLPTLLCIPVALIFRLNLIASQLANYLAYPLQLALLFLFLRAGAALFGTPPLAVTRNALLEMVRHQPLATTRLLWRWEWHAEVVWIFCAALLIPLLAALLTPVLERLLHKLAEPAQHNSEAL